MKPEDKFGKAVQSFSAAQLLRLKTYARQRIRWLGRKALGRNWEDLMHEAITATVSGQRVWPDDIDLYTHLIGAMRSISTMWHEKAGEEYLESELAGPGIETPLDRAVTLVDPERILRAKEELLQVRRLFANDLLASQVVELLGMGCTGKEIQAQLGLSARDYGTVAKRIRRKLQAQRPQLHEVVERRSSIDRRRPAA